MRVLRLLIRRFSYETMDYIEVYSPVSAFTFDQVRIKLLNFEGGEITCEKNNENGIAKVCINNPEKRNAISGKMMIDLENIVNDLQTWHNGKGIILYGKNKIFCSGGDLNFARKSNNPESGYEMGMFMSCVLRKFSCLPLVSVAYIDGSGAIGGGAEISTACDYRLCSSDPKTCIGFVHKRMGIVPAWGGTSRLVNIVGKYKALDLLLSGELLNSTDCRNMGLVNGIVNNFDEAYNWIADKVKHDACVVRAAKANVTNASHLTDKVIENEIRIFAPLWGGAANKLALEKNIKHK